MGRLKYPTKPQKCNTMIGVRIIGYHHPYVSDWPSLFMDQGRIGNEEDD